MTQQTQPEMIIEQGVESTIARRITMFDRRLHEEPHLFQESIQTLGVAILRNTIEITERDSRTARAVRTPEKLLTEYFENRYDLEHDFDDDTNTALYEDEEHNELLNAVKSRVSRQVRVGKMGSATKQNLEAVPARDQLRLYRLEFYIGRVVASKSMVQTEGMLNSAG